MGGPPRRGSDEKSVSHTRQRKTTGPMSKVRMKIAATKKGPRNHACWKRATASCEWKRSECNSVRMQELGEGTFGQERCERRVARNNIGRESEGIPLCVGR